MLPQQLTHAPGIYAQVSRSAGAWWSVDVSQIDDTDDNRLRRYLVSGGFGLGLSIGVMLPTASIRRS